MVKTVKVVGPKGPNDVVIVNETDVRDWIKRGYKIHVASAPAPKPIPMPTPPKP